MRSVNYYRRISLNFTYDVYYSEGDKMSRYTMPDTVDFRDWLSINCNDSFDIFMEKTGGVLSQEEDDGQITLFQVTSPCELMKLYDNIPLEITDTSVVLSEKTALQAWFEANTDGFPQCGLDYFQAIAARYPTFLCKYLLMEAYNKEFTKSINQQIIVG